MQAASFVNRAAVFLEPELMRFANTSFTSDGQSGSLSETQGHWVLSTTLVAFSIGALVGFLLLPYAISYCGPRDTSLLISNILLLLAIAMHVSVKTRCKYLEYLPGSLRTLQPVRIVHDRQISCRHKYRLGSFACLLHL